MQRDPTPQKAIFTSLPSLALVEVIAWWIMTGTLERFPKLKIVFVEPQLHWIPGFLAGLDRKVAGAYDIPGVKLKPSEYFRRNRERSALEFAPVATRGRERLQEQTLRGHPARDSDEPAARSPALEFMHRSRMEILPAVVESCLATAVDAAFTDAE